MKNFSIFLISLFSIINSVIYDKNFVETLERSYKCSDEMGSSKLCGIYSGQNNIFFIGKKCKKGYQCKDQLVGFYACTKKAELQKNGEKCKYNEECISGTCYNSKCIGTVKGQNCNSDDNCEAGNFCKGGKCQEFISEGKSCVSSDECGPRLLCNNEVCKEIGSLGIGIAVEDERLCSSGVAYGGLCVKVVQDGTCDEKNQCHPLVEGANGEGVLGQISAHVDCKTVNEVNICPLHTVKQILYSKYRSIISDLNVEKFFTDKRFTISHGTNSVSFGKTNAAKAYFLYKNFELLYSLGAFENNGKIKSDLNCEVDFLFTTESSSFNKVRYFLLLFSFTSILF